MSSKHRSSMLALALVVLASGGAHAEGRRRAERAPSPVIALNRQRMEALRPAVDQFLPLTADVQLLKSEWDRRLAAQGKRTFEAISMAQRELAMGTRAAEPGAIPRFMTLALRELHAYLAGNEVAEQDSLTSMWPSAVVAAGGYVQQIDQSYVSRMAALLMSTAKVFANPRVELEGLVRMSDSLALQGRMKEAYEARKAALELVAKIDDKAAIVAAIEYGGETREEAEREVGDQVTDRVADYLALAARVIVASPEPELQPAIRTILQRATRARFLGNGGVEVALAAHAAGQLELARKLVKEKASPAVDGEAQAMDAIAKVNAQLAAEYGIPMPSAQPRAPAELKDPDALLRLQLLEQIVATGAQITSPTWKELAKLAVKLEQRATEGNANANSGAERAHLLARAKEVRAQLIADAKAVIGAFALSSTAESLAEQYALMTVPLDADLSYLLDRIADKDLRLALLAVDIKQLERTRATLDKSDRAAFFASPRARRAYRSLLAAMIDRGKAHDLERALAVGELTRARQLKDVTGRGVGSFEKLL
ncbi:MAG TPA: hypothetical protein VFX59_16205, partial [Polyangiales bacterium]|nr:hypothetical protein [Polyangiales bacterium]